MYIQRDSNHRSSITQYKLPTDISNKWPLTKPTAAAAPLNHLGHNSSTCCQTSNEEKERINPLRDSMNQDLIDLLRSQVTKLLEENERIMFNTDDLKQKLKNAERVSME